MSETKTVVTTIERIFNPNDHGWADIKTADGKFSTKKPGIIGQARQFEDGRPVAVDYFEKQNGQYTNRYANQFRQPAAHEVNGGAVNRAVSATYDAPGIPGDPPSLPIGHPDLAPTTSSSTQDEFRRSKEEMRWTEALHIAALILPPGAGTIQLGELATLVEALIQERA